jgi:hypothetical protein
VFKINGLIAREVKMDTSEFRTVEIELPKNVRDGELVTIDVAMPDAVSPTLVGSQDPRTLGLALYDFALVERNY